MWLFTVWTTVVRFLVEALPPRPVRPWSLASHVYKMSGYADDVLIAWKETATRLGPMLCDTRCEGSGRSEATFLIWHPVGWNIDIIQRAGVATNGGGAVYNNRFVTNSKHKRWYAVWWGYVWRKDGVSVGSEERGVSRDTPWWLGFPSLQGGFSITTV